MCYHKYCLVMIYIPLVINCDFNFQTTYDLQISTLRMKLLLKAPNCVQQIKQYLIILIYNLQIKKKKSVCKGTQSFFTAAFFLIKTKQKTDTCSKAYS